MTDKPAPRPDAPLVVVGRVGKPFGNDGDVYVFADPDLGDPFAVGTTFRTADGTLTVARSRMHGDRLVVSFAGVEGREGAESVRGVVLSRPRSEVVLDEDVVWVADLVGRTVVDADGDLVGVVEGVRDGHAHDYLLLARPDGGEVLLPMVEELLDWAADPIVVQAVQGLVDPDESW